MMRWLAFYGSCFLLAFPILAARGPSNGSKAALFFISNEPSGNHVLTADIDGDGKLTFKKAVSTGGRGSVGVSSPRASESLFSGKGSIAVSQRAGLVAAVNAGSDTISLLSVNPNELTELFPVGRPVSSGGEFPMSVVFNEAGTKLCALNGGKVAGVKCFLVNKLFGLLPIPETSRSLPLNQTTPPSGPPGTASQVFFNHDETQLIAAVKGAPPESVGFLAVWDVARSGALSRAHRTIAPPAGGALPFSLTALPGTNAFVSADPALGFDVFDMAAPARGAAVPVADQIAICWSARSARTGHFFLSDTGSSVLSEVAVGKDLKGSLVKQFPLGNNSTGIIDLDIATIGSKDFIFVLAVGDTTVRAMRIDGPGRVTKVGTSNYAEFFKREGLNIHPQTAQGMVVFLKGETRVF